MNTCVDKDPIADKAVARVLLICLTRLPDIVDTVTIRLSTALLTEAVTKEDPASTALRAFTLPTEAVNAELEAITFPIPLSIEAVAAVEAEIDNSLTFIELTEAVLEELADRLLLIPFTIEAEEDEKAVRLLETALTTEADSAEEELRMTDFTFAKVAETELEADITFR